MQDIQNIYCDETLEIFHVITEPGDATRYDFILVRRGDEFTIAPCRSTFKFPQSFNKWVIRNVGEDTVGEHDYIIRKSNEYNCNPHTVKACIDVIRSIIKNDKE